MDEGQKERREDFFELLSLMDLKKMSRNFLLAALDDELMDDRRCRRLVQEALMVEENLLKTFILAFGPNTKYGLLAWLIVFSSMSLLHWVIAFCLIALGSIGISSRKRAHFPKTVDKNRMC
jgi:hypothetical protein